MSGKGGYNAVRDNDASWLKQPYGIIIGDDYGSYREAVIHSLAEAYSGSPDNKMSEEQALAKARKDVEQNEISDPYQYRSPRVSDASVGGNDAINPYSAFGLDDDIVHDTHKGSGYQYGMGRVYNEIYESKQQILYLTMGVPKYNNLTTYFKNATDKIASNMADNGFVSFGVKLGNLLAGGLMLAIELPWLPIIWMNNALHAAKELQVTDYFYLYSSMVLYYRTVNTLMSHIAVGMGLYATLGSASGANMTNEQRNRYSKNLPEIMKDGPDIFTILNKRAARLGETTRISGDAAVTKQASLAPRVAKKGKVIKSAPANKNTKSVSWWSKFTGSLVGTSLGGSDFIGFRVEKSTDASESFSNSTKDSELGQQLNGTVDENRKRSFGEIGGGAGFVAAGLKTVTQAKAAIDAAFGGLKSLTQYMVTSNGYFDLPKSWSGASFSRSYSFSMKLRARTGGDNVSIYQSEMIPLCLIMAAATPRAAGASTYTSPFIVRAFCKGMFSIPAGIITTLSVKRGDGEFGWSINKIPTVIDVSFSIEDLSPIMFLSLAAGDGAYKNLTEAFKNNSKMHEYLSTLTGIGLRERYFRLGQIKRKLAAAVLISKNTTFSSTYWGTWLGDTAAVKMITALSPWDRVTNN